MTVIELKPDEKAEPLDGAHYIIQNETLYRFGSDAVALAKFAAEHISRTDRVFDLCSGCGIIGILIAIDRGCDVRGAEINETLWDMSARSCAMNKLNNVGFYNADIKNIKDAAKGNAFDAVVCNPPFYKAGSLPRKIAAGANSEMTVEFRDAAKAAKYLLKQNGDFFVVHTATRMDEVLSTCREYGLMPKELIINENCKTFMLRARKGGRSGLEVCIKDGK